MARTRGWSVAARVFGVQLLAVLVIAGAILVVLALDARREAEDDAAALSLAVCETIAADPAVQLALESDDPTARLQPYARALVGQERVDFVTLMDPDGVRFTHPDPAQIGERFLGTISAARRGEALTETYTGTLGPSVRAVVPVERDGRLVGIVSAGVTTARVSAAVLPRIPFVIGIAVLVTGVGAIAAWGARRLVHRATGRMSAPQLAGMVRFYESVLHSVREGVVLTDERRRVVLYNDEAAELLALPPAPSHPAPRELTELGLDGAVAELLRSGRRVVEETHRAGDRVLLVNQEPAAGPGQAAGSGGAAVMTLRDQSDLQHLVGELESVRTMTDALRSQAHEHANTLHTIVSLLELGRSDEAIDLLSSATRTSQGLADAVLDTVADPVLGALLLGKAAQAHERGVDFTVDADDAVVLPLPAEAVVSVVGNLIDNALEAALGAPGPREVAVHLRGEADAVELTVVDSGVGLDATHRAQAFELGVSSKAEAGHGIGLALVRQIVRDHGGTVEFTAGRPTTVLVRLPRHSGPEASGGERRPTRPAETTERPAGTSP